jgi:3-methylcrotonyl-CoA carboxylase alpha subunit
VVALSVPRIRRLLIANRGEIAVRIARAAREAGIVPLGVYSEADVDAYHRTVMEADAPIGAAEARASYLNAEAILAAARSLGADAIHPGYGFLSERAEFARAVREAGLIFVGPPAEAIAAMGDKIEAKRRVRAHGVPVVPGYDGDDRSRERLRSEAEAIGTPLLIKASAGGGGRGMRVVDDLAHFDEALDAAQREALAAFGDATVLLERYLARPRHIEFQILADEHGHMIHLGERECSIQRRHQKVIEEAPSVALSPELRHEMGAAALRAARSAGYTNAGTVEFLLDDGGRFYFLEMNARLQVEHPVTEAVYGLDLVGWQLRIAGGERLTLAQEEIVPRGWAIEARICAEDPASGYLPAAGTIERWEPPTAPGLRLDAGVALGSEVSIYYDSLLAKLIAWGSDRPSALARLEAGLAAFEIAGVPTNLPLALAVIRDPAFAAGDTSTAFLAERPAYLHPPHREEPLEARLLALAAVAGDRRAWRVGGIGIPVALQGAGGPFRVTLSRSDDGAHLIVAGDIEAEFSLDAHGDRIALALGGQNVRGRASFAGGAAVVDYGGERYRFTLGAPPQLGVTQTHAPAGAPGAILAPMHGKIVAVNVKPGDAVAERDLLVVLEAMKMEHRIEAVHAGTVKRVAVTPGALVAGGALLVDIV